MSESFFFQLMNRTYSGFGETRNIGELLKNNGYKNVLVLLDAGIAGGEYCGEILDLMRVDAKSVETIVLRSSEEPDYDYLDEVATEARALPEVDVVIGIGGGSCMDIAKAIAALLTNPGPGLDYRGFDLVTIEPKPSICIPTTAGTGSEVTINAVFTNKQEQRKLGINGRFMNATYAILDAEWTMSCPVPVAVSSGMDALVHAVESFSCKQHNTVTRMFSKEGFRLLYENLPCLMDDPNNEQCRQKLLVGSYLAAAGLFNSGSGIAHVLMYPIGVHYKVPHGIGGGIFIVSEVEYNVERGYYEYAELLDVVEPNLGMDKEAKAKRFAVALNDLCRKLEVPKTLEQWGVTRENAEEVSKLMPVMQAGFDQNPLPFDAEKDSLPMILKHVE